MQSYQSAFTECWYNVVTMTLCFIYNGIKTRNNKTHTISLRSIKVRGPFVQTLCIEKDSYMDAI